MTDEEALKRGAEAGFALGRALIEVLPEKTEIAIKAAIAALTLLLATPAPAEACHRFSHWAYPFPQRCRVSSLPQWRAPARMTDAIRSPAPVASPAEAAQPYFVEITKLPSWDEVDHQHGIDQLKELQRQQH